MRSEYDGSTSLIWSHMRFFASSDVPVPDAHIAQGDSLKLTRQKKSWVNSVPATCQVIEDKFEDSLGAKAVRFSRLKPESHEEWDRRSSPANAVRRLAMLLGPGGWKAAFCAAVFIASAISNPRLTDGSWKQPSPDNNR